MKKWDPELGRTACSPVGTEHLAALPCKGSLGSVPVQHPGHRKGDLLGDASTHNNSKTPSVGFMHGEHLQALSLGSWGKFCKELRDDSRETWLGRISALGVFLGFFQSLLNTAAQYQAQVRVCLYHEGERMPQSRAQALLSRSLRADNKVLRAAQTAMPTPPLHTVPIQLLLPPPHPSQPGEGRPHITPVLNPPPPQSCCLRNHPAAQH